MVNFVQLAQGVILDRLLKSEPPFLSKLKIGLGFIALSGFFIVAGIGFMIFAAHLWFSILFTPPIAFALTGIIFMFLGLSGFLICYWMVEKQKKIFKKFKNEILDTVESLFEMLDEELKEPIGDNPKAAVFLASLGGYVTGKKIL